MTSQPQSPPAGDELDWLVNTIISYPITGRAIFVANAVQAGTPQSPIPVSPSANKEYQQAHKRIKKLVRPYILAQILELIGPNDPDPIDMERERSRRNQWRHEMRAAAQARFGTEEGNDNE